MNKCIEVHRQPPAYLPFLSWQIWTILQYLEYMREAAAVCVLTFPNQVLQTHVHGPVTGKKNNTSYHTVLTVLAVKTQISHKKKEEGELVRSGLLQLQLVWSLWGIVTVGWNPDWIFSVTTALSKAAKAKTPWQPAGSPSKLFVRESVMRNISTKRALTYFVSEANWTIYIQRLGCWIYCVHCEVKNILIKLCSFTLACITSGLA